MIFLEIENLYLNNHVESNQNSEYAADDDLEAELNVKYKKCINLS